MNVDDVLTAARATEPDKLSLEPAELADAVDEFVARGDAASALEVAGRTWRVWFRRGLNDEGSAVLEKALASSGSSIVPIWHARVLYAAGLFAFRAGDQDRSREFYRSLFDGQVLVERDPVIMKVANSWLILNVGGGPTDDKPTITLSTPPDPNRTSAFLNVRVADVASIYQEWSAKGAEFLTEPKDHGREIRAYVRDPDGHLIEVGQSVG